MNDQEIIQDVLQGHMTTQRWPKPKLAKIFIASTKTDFAEERSQLLEMVGPELQSIFDQKGLEVELVDMHYGSEFDPCLDAGLFVDHLHEVRDSHRVSRGCFFLCLVGNKYGPCPLPTQLSAASHAALTAAAQELALDAAILDTCYLQDEATSEFILQQPSDMTTSEWQITWGKLSAVLQRAAAHVAQSEPRAASKHRQLAQSAVEQQFNFALGLAPGTAHHMLAVVRDWHGIDGSDGDHQDLEEDGTPDAGRREQLNTFRESVDASLPAENRAYCSVSWKPGGLDTDVDEHDTYLTEFREIVTDKLEALINKSLLDEPDITSRNKTVQEVYQETLSHLTLCRDTIAHPQTIDFSRSDTLDRVRTLVTTARECAPNVRHGPIIVHGTHGSGKTSLIASIYTSSPSWFDCGLYRIVRFSSTTPRSAYNLEMVRVICQQLCMLLHLPEGYLPKDASFDPLYVNNWFQTLIRKFEESSKCLLILIDDLHRLNPLDSDIVAGLSWLPISLPRNVHIVGTTSASPEGLKLTPVQKERFRGPDCYVELPSTETGEVLASQMDASLDSLESRYGRPAIARLSSLLSCTEFGLTETELLELLMPTGNGTAALSLAAGHFNFSTLCSVRRQMGDLIRERLMSGKTLLKWRHELANDTAKRRYLPTQDTLRAAHAEIANLFFSEFAQQASDAEPETEAEAAPEETSPTESKETPFQTTLPAEDVTYSLRHVEESWIHLLKAGDTNRLKQLTVCNFDFLLAAVQTVSVSYLRCVLEHVRCYLLSRDLELVYYTIRKSSDVLTRDPLQLGAQIICWLRTHTESGTDLVGRMITSAMAWCDGYNAPLLVPLNGWLTPPLPLQIKSVHCASGVKLIEPTPSGQHVVVVPATGDPQLWHVMSNSLIHTFKGHSGPVLCLAITRQAQYLLTGSEDISIIVWDIKTLNLKLRIYEHIAPVLCLTPALGNSVIVSGGEDSRIIVTSLLSGDVVMKIDHHRGPVTSVKVNSAGDVLVSGSSDRTVCLWSLDNFNLLNTISLPSPVTMLDVSVDSVFLLAACEDNQLYLRVMATGTEIHCLKGHKALVRSVCLAQDNCRAVVGGSDGKIYIFDMHSGRLSRTLTSHASEVTGVKVTDQDDFLLTGGGNRITFWSFRRDEVAASCAHLCRKAAPQVQHTAPINCLDMARDGQLAVTGSVDCLVNLWQVNTHELHSTLEGHTAPVTCVAFAPNGLFAASGSEDTTVRVWGLTLGLVVSVFKGHSAPVCAVTVMGDSRRVVSSDRHGSLAVWVADNATLLHSCAGPGKCLAVTNNMKHVVCGNGDNSLRIWSLPREDERYTVAHGEEVTCFVLSVDSLHVITGSKDTSLKVWQVQGGKLAQVLIGHTDHVTCVAVSISNKSMVVSGSRDSNLIVWDINTGQDVHTLKGHLGHVTCVKVTGDGSLAVSGSEDKSMLVWDTKRGRAISSLTLHVPVLGLEMSTDSSRIAAHLLDVTSLPIVCLHNTPATYVKMPAYVAPANEMEDLRPSGPKRPMRRLLKKEVSLDTYTWQKKYGHLTSSIMMAAVDERLKRRFSVSASMEEISKIPAKGNMGSQGIGPEQAALAQSQHFDQLEALWNKRSPPRRRHNQTLSKQNSRSSRRDSSDTAEEKTPGDEIVDLPGDRMCV